MKRVLCYVLCDCCEKKYAHLRKVHQCQCLGCRGHPSETCIVSSSRSSTCFTLPSTPEKAEADFEAGNRLKEGEEKRDEVAALDNVSVNEQEDRGIVFGEVEKLDRDEVEEVWIY